MKTAKEAENFIVELCHEKPNGITQNDLKELPENLKQQALNTLLKEKRLEILRDGQNLLFTLISEKNTEILKGLKFEEETIYKLIEQSGNTGIWQKTLKFKSKLQTKQITKITATLIQKKLIKSVQTIQGKNKKVFMLYHLEPSREITGGIWYDGAEFNSQRISALQIETCNLIYSKKYINAKSILEHVRTSGVTSGIDLQLEDMQNIINTLIYDGLIEKVDTLSEIKYKPKNVDQDATWNAFSDIPCATCPVFSKCSEDSNINPKICPYLQQWMESDFDF